MGPASVHAPPLVHLQPRVGVWLALSAVGVAAAAVLWLVGSVRLSSRVMLLATWHWKYFKSAKIEKKKKKTHPFLVKLCTRQPQRGSQSCVNKEEGEQDMKGRKGKKKNSACIRSWVCDGND